jgi:hypothetical protein
MDRDLGIRQVVLLQYDPVLTCETDGDFNRQISPLPNSRPDDETALVSPNIEPQSLDLRCGRNASVAWNKPKTATVRAGDRVGFAAGEPKLTVIL